MTHDRVGRIQATKASNGCSVAKSDLVQIDLNLLVHSKVAAVLCTDYHCAGPYLYVGYLYYSDSDLHWKVLRCRKNKVPVELDFGAIATPLGALVVEHAFCRFDDAGVFRYGALIRDDSDEPLPQKHYLFGTIEKTDAPEDYYSVTFSKSLPVAILENRTYEPDQLEYAAVHGNHIVVVGSQTLYQELEYVDRRIPTGALHVEIYDRDSEALKAFFSYVVPELLTIIEVTEDSHNTTDDESDATIVTLSLNGVIGEMGKITIQEKYSRIQCHAPKWCELIELFDAVINPRRYDGTRALATKSLAGSTTTFHPSVKE